MRGTGFQPGETVNILFDGNLVSSATGGRTGKVLQMITVPGTALPGDHMVEADGLTSGFGARAFFLARTDWAQACSPSCSD